MGQITNWNDPAIKKLNPKATLPDLKITPGLPHRQLGHDLQLHRLPRRRSARAGSRSSAPASRSTGRPASARAATPASPASSPNTPGAIGYIDTAFAIANHLRFAAIKNAAGKFINPSIRNVAAAGGAVTKVPANNELHIVNPPKSLPTAYPIATYTYIILPTKSSKAARAPEDGLLGADPGPAGKYTAQALVRRRSRRSCSSRREKTLKQVAAVDAESGRVGPRLPSGGDRADRAPPGALSAFS